ncbi:MAG: DUF2892 domain-containing protein [Deltaproteobacteria bacterium]|nr:DUF2892 domain-containing protein [Deltaproteobacteria bacterium]
MNFNIGGIDRSLRIIVGIVIGGIGVAFGSWWGLIGIIPLFTGVIGWCPAYMPFGLSTCRVKNKGN